jgi:endo-1,4-beta-xylanase
VSRHFSAFDFTGFRAPAAARRRALGVQHPARRAVLAGLLALPAARGGRAGAATGEITPSLARAAAAGGRYFGAAARIEQIEAESPLRRTVLRDCAWLTPEIALKWDAIWPAPDRLEFAGADGLVAFAREHGMQVRGHTLLWDQSTPGWARQALTDSRDWRLARRYFETVLARYDDRVRLWDVVNEPIAADAEGGAGGLRRNLFFEAFGPDYVRRALETAHAVAPRARLAINDFGFDYDNPVEAARRTAFLKLLTRLKRQGAPLHAVGLQAHLDLGKGPLRPEIIAPFLKEIADLGLTITITELDVRERDFGLPLAERDQRVAAAARAYLDAALAEPAVEGVITWGLSDRHSWLQDAATAASGGLNRGLPYDEAMRPKPMYWQLGAAMRRERA